MIKENTKHILIPTLQRNCSYMDNITPWSRQTFASIRVYNTVAESCYLQTWWSFETVLETLWALFERLCDSSPCVWRFLRIHKEIAVLIFVWTDWLGLWRLSIDRLNYQQCSREGRHTQREFVTRFRRDWRGESKAGEQMPGSFFLRRHCPRSCSGSHESRKLSTLSKFEPINLVTMAR